jgi:CRP-like cAMP-binding protein/cytochrome P450
VPGIPLLGNSLQLAANPAAFFVGAYQKFGPIFKVNVFFQDYTVLAGKEAFTFFLKEKERYFSRESFYKAFSKELGTDQFILGEAAHLHQHLRGQMRVAYSRQVAAEYIPSMFEAIDTMLDERPPGSEVVAMDFVAEVAFDQYSRVMCGRSLRHFYPDAALYTQRIMNVGAKIWPEASLSLPGYRHARKRVFELMYQLVDEFKDRSQDVGPHFTIMDAMLAAKTDEGGPMDVADQIACVLYGFIGTIIYMNRAMSFLLYDLLNDREMLARVTEEADAVFAHGPPDSMALRGMTLLKASLKESMRLHPIALGLPFIAEQDFAFEGRAVHRGEQCVVSGVTGHFSEDFYKCPHQFDVDRVLPPREEQKAKGAHVPFGFSIRTCPAGGLVETIVLCTLSRMLHRREMTMTPAGHKLKTRLDPLPGPSKGFHIRLGDARRPGAATEEMRWQFTSNAIEELISSDALQDPHLRECLERVKPHRFPAGHLIIREGDPADTFYVLLEGEVQVTKGPEEQPVKRLKPGTYFGERGLIGDGRRQANCRAVTNVLVLEMGEEDFHAIVRESDLVPGEIATAAKRSYLTSRIRAAIPHIDTRELALAGVLEGARIEDHAAGTKIIVQGDDADTFYILLDGRVRVLEESHTPPTVLAELASGDFFGEIGILQSRPRVATVQVTDDGPAQVLALPRRRLLDVVERFPSARADIGSVIAGRLVQALAAH